jgi:hypothetical protein
MVVEDESIAVAHRIVEHARVWALYASAPGAALLRLDPWRLHVADAMTVATPRVWKADTAYR